VRSTGERAAAWACAVLGIAVYGRALGAGFFSDDYTWLGRMAATRLHPLYLLSIFFRDFNPLLHASFMLDDLVGGGRPGTFHATSLLVHALCALLIVILCGRLGAHPLVAGAAGLTFAINVRLSEAVIWPAARGHSLAALFVLSALVLLRGTWRFRIAGATLCFALALLAKETAFSPILLTPLFIAGRRRALDLLPFGLLAAGFAAFNWVAKPSFHYAAGSAGALVLKVPFLLLRPIGLGDAYDFSPLACLLVLGLLAGAVLLLRRTVAFVGFLWIAVCLAPILPLEKLSSRYLYLLSIGYAFVLCGAVEWVAARRGLSNLRRAAPALAGGALALVAATNAILIQREIEDYALLAEPYAACLEALRRPAADLRPGETLIVADTSARDAVARMNRLTFERGTMVKLIPYRAAAVGGLIRLPDAVNIVRRGRDGWLGAPTTPAEAVPGTAAPAATAPDAPAAARRIYVYDGLRTNPLPDLPAVPASRLFLARLARYPEYRAAEVASGP